METDVLTDELNLKDEEEFLMTIESSLSSVESSMTKFLQDVPQALAMSGLNLSLQNVNLDVERLLAVEKSSSTDQKSREDEKEKRISKLELECERLRIQLQRQINENERTQEEMEQLKDQILNQSTYCASLGAVLGNLTWRASRFSQIVDVWLSGFQDKLGEFLSIADGSFVAFINTYGNSFPPTNNVEYEFIIGLLGIVTNVSASPEGREFLITNPNGKDFVQKIIKLMPTLPLSPGSLSLKRLMLMILYNVSINKTGLQHLFESRVGDALKYYLENKSLPEEIQLLCLSVLQSITYELTNPKYIRDLNASIPLAKVEDIVTSNKNDMAAVAKDIVKHLRDSQKYVNLN